MLGGDVLRRHDVMAVRKEGRAEARHPEVHLLIEPSPEAPASLNLLRARYNSFKYRPVGGDEMTVQLGLTVIEENHAGSPRLLSQEAAVMRFTVKNKCDWQPYFALVSTLAITDVASPIAASRSLRQRHPGDLHDAKLIEQLNLLAVQHWNVATTSSGRDQDTELILRDRPCPRCRPKGLVPVRISHSAVGLESHR